MCFTPLAAQNATVISGADNTVNPSTKYKHEINLLYGDCLLIDLINDLEGERYTRVGAFSSSYLYHFKKWISFGATLSYIPAYRHYYKTIYNENSDGSFSIENKRTTLNRAHIAMAGEVRFCFFSKEWVRLYGGLAIGYTLNFSKEDITPNIFIQPTFFGFSFGKKFVFGGEFGCGSKGLLNAYIGYKF
jgi:hypothetical protein